MIDCGNGIPIVLIPGLQGRWEWMRPAVTALAKHNRVLSFSLCDERTSPFPCDPAKAFENYISQVEMALDRARIDRAVIAGVSYGGLIATEFAARNPDRVSGLVLANALHASWQPNSAATALPGFADPVGADVPCRRGCTRAGGAARRPADALPIGCALPWSRARGSCWRRARPRKWRGASRGRGRIDLRMRNGVQTPTLILTGEPDLDKVVPVDVTRRYLNDFAGAEHVVLERTGHNGLVTRPDAFAGVLERFVNGARIPA